MTRTACQYAIVRFEPFLETGEFANVGVVLVAPHARFFDFDLKINRYGRVTRFFAELEARTYRNAMKALRNELKRSAAIFRRHGFDRRLKKNDIDFANTFFREITRPRETMIRFGEVRTVLADDPKLKLKELFDFYVERNFVTKEYKEAALERSVKQWLKQADLVERFVRDTIGVPEYHVTFPFVQKDGDNPRKIIKPLNLAHDDPTQITDHGGTWLFRLAELRDRRVLPERVMFTVDQPKGKKDLHPRAKACEKIVTRLENEGIDVVAQTIKNKQAIIEFAAGSH